MNLIKNKEVGHQNNIMKNIYVLPTDEPSRLIYDKEENRLLPLQKAAIFMVHQDLVGNQKINNQKNKYMEHYYVVTGNEFGIDLTSKKNFLINELDLAEAYFETQVDQDFVCILMEVKSNGTETMINQAMDL